jgi:hypothetical protein
MGVEYSTNWGEEEHLEVISGKIRGIETLGRPRRGLEDNIEMDLREIRNDGVNWIGLAQDRDKWKYLVNVVMHLRVP